MDVATKIGIREGARASFVNAPEAAQATIDPPDLDVAAELTGEFRLHPGLREDPGGA